MYILETVVFFSVLQLLVTSALGASVQYSYDDQAAWSNLENSECGGTTQSPINVITEDLAKGDEIGLDNLVFSYLDDNLYGTFTNNGHSLQFTPDETADPRTVQTYRGSYELLQFHFHWGANNDQGSEHWVDNKQFSGELHFVHKTTTANAAVGFDYYTVVGVLLEADDDLSATDTIWEAFSSDIPEYGEELNITEQTSTFNNLLPSDRSYYYYNGSLTTPLCNEIVQWVLLKEPMSVPSSFLSALRTTQESNEEYLTHNFRAVQPLNGRKVYDSAANSLMAPAATILLLSIALVWFY